MLDKCLKTLSDHSLTYSLAYWHSGSLIEKCSGGFNKDTQFQAASISKFIFSVLCTKLSMAGMLSLEENVSFDTHYGTLTFPLYRYLNHTTGANVPSYPGYKSDETIPSLVSILQGQGNVAQLDFDIQRSGEYAYSGHGYSVAQNFVEKKLGKALEKIAHEYLFEPLGLSRSIYALTPIDNNYAQGVYGAVNVKGGYNRYPEAAAAGLWSTPSDLLRIVQHCLENDIWEALINNQFMVETISPIGSYFLGIRRNENGVYFHGGSNHGYKARLEIDVSNKTIFCLMINNEDGRFMTDREFKGFL